MALSKRDEECVRVSPERVKGKKALPFVVMAKQRCGCCHVEMRFKNRSSAHSAFDRAGFEQTTITDDAGTVHQEVDTFYGFWEKGEKNRGLGYLFDLAIGNTSWP